MAEDDGLPQPGWLSVLGEGIRPHAFFLFIVAGVILAMILLPENHRVGGMLFVLGMIAGQWAEQLNPREAEEEEEELPSPPWKEMDAAEKRAYVLPPLVLGAFAILLLIAAFQFDFWEFGWLPLLAALAFTAMAIRSGWRRWTERFGT